MPGFPVDLLIWLRVSPFYGGEIALSPVGGLPNGLGGSPALGSLVSS